MCNYLQENLQYLSFDSISFEIVLLKIGKYVIEELETTVLDEFKDKVLLGLDLLLVNLLNRRILFGYD